MDFDLPMVDHLLMTTRAVKKRLDFSRHVEPEVIERCIEIALQAPTGSNIQGWHFIVVMDQSKRYEIAEVYRKALRTYGMLRQQYPLNFKAEDPRTDGQAKVGETSAYLAEHMHEAPVMVIPCISYKANDAPHWFKGDIPDRMYNAALYGSILPAAWSFMLAARARGLGTAWTTVHTVYEEEVATILGIPEGVLQTALIPVAYYKGTEFKPANRLPVQQVTHWDQWEQRRE
jgi:nitroreductase